MKIWQRNGILAVALLAFGVARMPFEAGLAKDLRAANLSPPVMEVGAMDKVGQTSAAVVLGGLRTLVATFLNLRAFSFFEETRWDDVADTYGVIVDLAPRTAYYWDSGSWHSAYNAASFYINDSTLSPMRRKEAWRSSIKRGRTFLERGIRNNPDSWVLWAQLGKLLSDPNKFPAFPDQDATFALAADAYRQADKAGNAPPFVMRASLASLARVKGREAEALALARSLAATKANRTPTLLSLLFVLEVHANPAVDTTRLAIEIFGTPKSAYETLSHQWRDTRSKFPVYGIATALEALEKQLAISADESILNQPLPPTITPDQWFEK